MAQQVLISLSARRGIKSWPSLLTTCQTPITQYETRVAYRMNMKRFDTLRN